MPLPFLLSVFCVYTQFATKKKKKKTNKCYQFIIINWSTLSPFLSDSVANPSDLARVLFLTCAKMSNTVTVTPVQKSQHTWGSDDGVGMGHTHLVGLGARHPQSGGISPCRRSKADHEEDRAHRHPYEPDPEALVSQTPPFHCGRFESASAGLFFLRCESPLLPGSGDTSWFR